MVHGIKYQAVIKKCSECGCLIDDRRISTSGLVIGLWTDGKTNRSGLNMSGGNYACERYFVKCPSCLKTMWFDELITISIASHINGTYDEVKRSRPFSVPKIIDYCAELSKWGLTDENEYMLRTALWWAGNDKRRGMRRKKPLLNEEIDNLRILVEMLGSSVADSWSKKAEIKRELGLFEEAYELLSKPFDNAKKNKYRMFMKKLVMKKDSTVRAYPDEIMTVRHRFI